MNRQIVTKARRTRFRVNENCASDKQLFKRLASKQARRSSTVQRGVVQLELQLPVVKPHITHMSPTTSPTKSKEPRVITMFWKRLKSGDRNTMNHNRNMTQTISARIDTTVGTSGFSCFPLIEIPFYYQRCKK